MGADRENEKFYFFKRGTSSFKLTRYVRCYFIPANESVMLRASHITWSILCHKSYETDPYPENWISARENAQLPILVFQDVKVDSQGRKRHERRRAPRGCICEIVCDWCSIDHRPFQLITHTVSIYYESGISYIFLQTLKILFESSIIAFYNV